MRVPRGILVLIRLMMTARNPRPLLPNQGDWRSVRQRRRPLHLWFHLRQFPCNPESYNVLADRVSQAETLPSLKPAKNQRLRCSDVPWVKASGTT
jgi:hypothetical protein